MVLKRHFGDEANNNSPSSKFQKVVRYVMRDASLQEVAEKLAVMLETTLRKVMKEELEQHIDACLHSSPRRSLLHHHESSPSRGFQLQFTTKLPGTLFSNGRIPPLEIQLIDTNTKNVIHSGQLSSIKVEIVAVSGDFAANGLENWTKTKFNDSVLRERQGKRPLLIGDLSIVLVNGVGSLVNVTFTDNSSWIRCRKFKLGARVVSSASIGSGIKEAVSDAFVVLDHRGESYQKHSKPSLDDPVWRLRKISKVGASRNKLESHGITTVRDFLMRYYMDPSSLRRVLGKSVANRSWDTVVRHANDCHLENTYYHFCSESDSIVLLLNCVYKVIAVKFTDQDYQSLDSLNIYQKALVEKVKQYAYLNLNEVVQLHNSPDISSLKLPTVDHDVPFSSSLMNHGDFSIDQDEPNDKQTDFNLLDTASYPGTAEQGCYQTEDESTSQTDQPIPVQWFAQPSFVTGNSSSLPSVGGYNWYSSDSPNLTFAHNHQSF
ncbi:hypothetical protein RND81_04G218800 [Saponaria officinalis]|uniref:Calmodulin-binding protein n=1 Tax=Saponaria officinalis TaxID=3572 RepID=A0AAW1LPK2_SAPOF